MHFFNSAREHWILFILEIQCKGCMMMMNGRELSIISISIFGGAFITADNLAEYTNMILVYSVYNIYTPTCFPRPSGFFVVGMQITVAFFTSSADPDRFFCPNKNSPISILFNEENIYSKMCIIITF